LITLGFSVAMSQSHVLKSQPIPRMRLIQEGSLSSLMGDIAGGDGGGATSQGYPGLRDEFLEAGAASSSGSGGLRAPTVMSAGARRPVVSKTPKSTKRSATVASIGASPALKPGGNKKRKSMEGASNSRVMMIPGSTTHVVHGPLSPPLAQAAPPQASLPQVPSGGSLGPRPAHCKYNRNSYPMINQPSAQQPQQQQTRRRRTVEDFLTFCTMILDYENYTEQEDRKRHSSSPLGSTGSSTGSGGWEPPPPTATNGSSSHGIQLETPSGGDTDVDREELKKEDGGDMSDSYGQLSPPRGGPHHPDTDDTNTNDEIDAAEEDGWNSVTCFCRKPFAGRPMIECSACLTWVHLKCANMHRKKIPDEWYCPSCRGLAPPGSGPIQESPSSSSTSSNNKTPKQVASKTKTTPKSAPSPTKPVSGSRKRKSSTSKRVVVIKNSTDSTTNLVSAPTSGEPTPSSSYPSAVSPAADNKRTKSPVSTSQAASSKRSPGATVKVKTDTSDTFLGETQPKQEVKSEQS